MAIDLIDELKWRGLFHQCTNEDKLRAHLANPAANPRKGYAGFDPTADSLTIGNLVPIMALVHLQRAGHTPIVVMGGGTGLIGDPSGKSDERQLMTDERVNANVNSQRRIYEALLDFSGPNAATLVDNADWLCKLSYVDALRDIGKHFSVNMMVQKESVRARLEDRDHGISYTEFSYMILQAYDFWHLYRDQGVTLQLGGSDQWGNIVAGSDLIRRSTPGEESESYGLTVPLVTKSDGGKFGKTESGAIWLTADRTSPFAFYQFWLNSSDEDVIRYLSLFTLMPQEEVTALTAAHEQAPGKREAHRALASHMTQLLHGPTEADNAQAAAVALFSGDVAGLPEATLDEVFAEVASSEHDKTQLAGEGIALIDLLVETTLASSKRDSRQHLTSGAVSVNGAKVGLDDHLTTSDLLHGKTIALRRGKKTWHVTRWQ